MCIQTTRSGNRKGTDYRQSERLKIDNMREQHTNKINFSAEAPKAEAPKAEQPKKDVGFVSISAGEGLTKIFKNLGVDEVIEGGQTMNQHRGYPQCGGINDA
mgnify:CR=1 FL=1